MPSFLFGWNVEDRKQMSCLGGVATPWMSLVWEALQVDICILILETNTNKHSTKGKKKVMFLYKQKKPKKTLKQKNTNNTNNRINFDKKRKKTSKVPFPYKQTTFTTNKTFTRSLKLEKQSLVVLEAL